MNIKTITSSDGVNAVDFGSAASRFYWFKNIGTTTVYVSGNDNITADGDGVAELTAGGSVCIETLGGKVYILGAGKVQIHNTGDKFCPFRNAPVAGGGGETATVIGDNLLINSNFEINQRAVSGEFSDVGKYFVDRWKLVSGSVTVNADRTITLNGSICQILENAVGTNVTASVSAGTVAYDDATKTFTITGDGKIISWAKWEYGNAATPFVTPDPVSELAKCCRYYEILKYTIATGYFHSTTSSIGAAYFYPKRKKPTITVDGDLLIWVNSYVASNGIPVKSVEIVAYNPNSINCRMSFTVESGGIANAPCIAEMRNGKFILDAEIY